MYVAASAAVWVFILLPLLVIWAVGTIAYFLLRKPTDKEIERARQARQAARE
jgi:hypothetical protein